MHTIVPWQAWKLIIFVSEMWKFSKNIFSKEIFVVKGKWRIFENMQQYFNSQNGVCTTNELCVTDKCWSCLCTTVIWQLCHEPRNNDPGGYFKIPIEFSLHPCSITPRNSGRHNSWHGIHPHDVQRLEEGSWVGPSQVWEKQKHCVFVFTAEGFKSLSTYCFVVSIFTFNAIPFDKREDGKSHTHKPRPPPPPKRKESQKRRWDNTHTHTKKSPKKKKNKKKYSTRFLCGLPIPKHLALDCPIHFVWSKDEERCCSGNEGLVQGRSWVWDLNSQNYPVWGPHPM
jgi:hypothetical protein